VSFILKKNTSYLIIIIGDTMNIIDIFTKKDILREVESRNKIIRLIIFLVCCFFVALMYNVFFVPNNLVIGGVGGLAIVMKQVFGLNTSLFISIMTIILLILSNILLGKEETKKNIFGAITYPVLTALTEPIAKYINISFESYLFTILIAIIVYSIPLGIIYKVGYSTGGGDIINQIICKFRKTSIGQASAYMNIIIIFTASFVFGIPKTIYALFALLLENAIVDFVVLGNSDSKLCIIKTKNIEYIEESLHKDFNIGYSVFSSLGGTDRKKRRTIMCVVTSREYYRFKNLILDIDPNAFFVTHDCYEVLGGFKKRKIKLN